MDLSQCNVRCCISIRGTHSSTTKDVIHNYCEMYGQVSYIRCAFDSRGIMRGFDVLYKHEQSVNRFMDNRPHNIDKKLVKVRRCIPADEEWRFTNTILITTSDSSIDKQVFQEETLRDYFSKYGAIRKCQIDIHHDRPCAYLTFADYDRVDQLINDKPHTINKITIHIRKYILNKDTPSQSDKKHRRYSSTDSEHQRIKQPRSSLNKTHQSPTSLSSKIIPQEKSANRLKNANDLLTYDVQSFISTPISINNPTENNEILCLQTEYTRLNSQMINLRDKQINKSLDQETNEILHRLENDVEHLLQQIKHMQGKQSEKTFTDQLFEKYTIEYILSLNENDVQQRLEQLEKENQLLLLILQNMPKKDSTDNRTIVI